MLLTKDLLEINDYPRLLENTNEIALEEPVTKKCDRCGKFFFPKTLSAMTQREKSACKYHPEKAWSDMNQGERLRNYLCCGRNIGDSGCEFGPHVFKVDAFEQLAKLNEFKKPKTTNSDSKKFQVLAFDCEMLYTLSGMEVVRLSVVNEYLDKVLDVFIKTKSDIIDYNTRWSGIDKEIYEKSQKVGLEEAQQLLFDLMILEEDASRNSILAGHSLENDLKVMRIVYDRCIDTSLLYDHPKGTSYKYSLKFLAQKLLKKFIQEGTHGHDPIEDSRTAMEIIRFKISNPLSKV